MNTIRRAVAPLLVCLLLLPLLLRDSALAAADQNRPAGDKAWRVIYVEGGPFSDYQRIFQGLALGLEERIGSLVAGKQADLVILDRDPLAVPQEELRDIRVLETWKDGVPIFCREA